MGEIQTFKEEHIPEAAALELQIFHGRQEPAGAALRKYFSEIFLANPWRDPELSSLVYLEKGKVAGFLGVLPRRMLFDGQPVRVAVASQLMADRSRTNAYAGMKLMERFLAGAQDLSLTDGATEAAYAVWTACGASVARAYSLQWRRMMRPAAYARALTEQHPRFGKTARAMKPLLAPASALADAALSRIPARMFGAPLSVFPSAPATSAELLAAIHAVGRRDALRPCYEAESFDWLLAQAALARRHGELRKAVVRDAAGGAAGWYAYYAKRGGESTVLQFGASPLAAEAVIQALLRDAWDAGSAAVSGQNVPQFMLPLARQNCVFVYPGNGVLIHSRRPEITACILQGGAALTRLDGEWWMRFAAENWQ